MWKWANLWNEHYMWHMEILRHTHAVHYILFIYFIHPFPLDGLGSFFFVSRVHSLLFVCSFNRFLVVNLFHYSSSLPNTRYTFIYATSYFVAKRMTFPRRVSILSVCGLFKIWQTKQTTNLSWTCNTTPRAQIMIDFFFPPSTFPFPFWFR